MADVTFDWQRRERIGLAEAVLCAGKTAVQVGETIALARSRRAALLLTRLTPALLAELAPAERRRSTTIRARGPRSSARRPSPRASRRSRS